MNEHTSVSRLSFSQLFSLFCLAVGVLLAASLLFAWTGPTETAPGGNVAAPINVGATDQVKDGGLSVNTLSVVGRQYIQSGLNIGVLTDNQVVALNVNGTIKLGSGSETCQSVTEGSLRYSATTKALQYCNGSSWFALAAVPVVVVPTTTCTLSASPASITAGQNSTLSWSSGNATSISIDNGVGAQPLNGTAIVHPSATTLYTLTATGDDGTVTCTQTITVGKSIVVPPTISSLSPTSGPVGTRVAITGTGFTSTNNSIKFGGGYLNGLSSNGTTMTFTIPSSLGTCLPAGGTTCPALAMVVLPGSSYAVSVINANGTSNTKTFTVTSGGVPESPSVNSLSPASGVVGTVITITGSGFTATGNTVHFGVGGKKNVSSSNGTSISYTIPNSVSGCDLWTSSFSCTQVVSLVTPGTYTIYVTNANGTSNSKTFTVASPPTISSISGPTSRTVGQSGTWTVNASVSGGGNVSYSVVWGDELSAADAAAAATRLVSSATFTHVYMKAGTYTPRFTVSNSNGLAQKNAASVSVAPIVSSLSPTSGKVGTVVTIAGSGFTATGNTVHFGVGGKLNVSSSNGTSISYTIPNSVSACDLFGSTCRSPQYLVSPGAYSISVSSANVTSNAKTFTVN